jgi:hypothetical protein
MTPESEKPRMRNPRLSTVKMAQDTTLSKRIRDGYAPAEACPPLSDHWGGAPLSQTPWLGSFAEAIATTPDAAEAWTKLELKMRKDDLCFLVELLYLYVFLDTTLMERNRESYRVLGAALDKIVPAYDELIERVSALTKSNEAKTVLVYQGIADDLRALSAARNRAEEARKQADVRGSKKARSRDWYLHLMVSEMERAMGAQEIEFLCRLIDIAREANDDKLDKDDEPEFLDAETLKKRVQRYRKRYGYRKPLRPVPFPLDVSKEELAEINAQALIDAQEYYDSEEFRNSGQSSEPPHSPSDDDIPF